MIFGKTFAHTIKGIRARISTLEEINAERKYQSKPTAKMSLRRIGKDGNPVPHPRYGGFGCPYNSAYKSVPVADVVKALAKEMGVKLIYQEGIDGHLSVKKVPVQPEHDRIAEKGD